MNSSTRRILHSKMPVEREASCNNWRAPPLEYRCVAVSKRPGVEEYIYPTWRLSNKCLPSQHLFVSSAYLLCTQVKHGLRTTRSWPLDRSSCSRSKENSFWNKTASINFPRQDSRRQWCWRPSWGNLEETAPASPLPSPSLSPPPLDFHATSPSFSSSKK